MYRLGHVASKLNVPPGLVQRWTRDYADWLGEDATTLTRGVDGRFRPRRYTDEDVAVLERLKALDAAGLTPREIRARLASPNGSRDDRIEVSSRPYPEVPTAPYETTTPEPTDARAPTPETEAPTAPHEATTSSQMESPPSVPDPTHEPRDELDRAAAPGHELVTYDAPRDALSLLQQTRDSHQALLAAHQAQREMLSAMIENAAALKNENTQLRKRLRMMEEQMTRLQESDWSHRLTLEERMNELEQELNEAKAKRSWWQRLFGQ